MLKKIVPVLFALLPLFSAADSGNVSAEKRFLDLKKKALDGEALSVLKDAFFGGQTGSASKIFFLQEFSGSPELADDVLSILNESEKKGEFDSPYLKALCGQLRLKINAEKYKFNECSRILSSGGYPLSFKISRPLLSFSNGDLASAVSSDYFKKDTGTIIPDYDSSVSPETFLNSSEGAFILRTGFTFSGNEAPLFYLGRSGFMIVLIDGTEVYRGSDPRNYSAVQDAFSAVLTEGNHLMEIRTAADDSGAMRFSISSQSRGIKFLPDALESGGKCAGSAIVPLPFASEEKGCHRFFRGFVRFMTGFDSSSEFSCESDFSSVDVSDYYYPHALYYRAMSESGYSKKDYYLRGAYSADKSYYEALIQLGFIKYKTGMLYQCGEIIETLDKRNAYSPAAHLLKGAFFAAKGWTDLALKEGEALGKAGCGYAANVINYKAYAADGDRFRMRNSLFKAAAIKRDSSLADDLRECSAGTDFYAGDMKFLMDSYPSIPLYSINYAEVLLYSGKKQEASAIIASVKRKIPWAAYADYLAGEMDSMKNNPAAAEHYRNAYMNDNSDSYYKELYNYLSRRDEPLDEYFPKRDTDAFVKASAEFKDEPSVVLFDDTVEKIFSDGTVREKRRTAILINDAENAQNVKYQSFYYDPSSDYVDRIKAGIISEGVRKDVTNISSRNMSDAASRMYYDMEAVTVTFDPLSSGDIIFLEYSITKRENGLKGFYSEKKYFDISSRILSGTVKIVSEYSKPLYYKVYNSNIKPYVKNKSGSTEYGIEMNGLAPLRDEEGSPHYSDLYPSFAVSTFAGWNDFNKWYYDLIKDKTVMTEEMKSKADELVKGVSGNEEKIRRIYSFVTERIRYVGFELGAGSIIPRKTDSVYNSSLGDCKDTALLISAFLNYCGIKSSVSLLRTKNSGSADRDFPFLGAFNHAICRVDFKGGLYLDGTVDRADIYELPDNDRGSDCFIVGKDSYFFEKAEDSKYIPSKEINVTGIKISKDGSASFERTLEKSGSLALYLRESFDIENKKRGEIEEYWRNEHPGSSLSSFSVTEKKPGKPLVYAYTGILPEIAAFNGGYMIFPAVIQKDYYLRSLRKFSSRENDLKFSYPYSGESVYHYEVPEGYSIVKIPSPYSGSCGPLKVSFKAELKDERHLTVTIVSEVRDGKISSHEYSNLRDELIRYSEREDSLIVAEKK